MVGDLLRREREKKNLTIADVEKETSISKKYLEALEKGEYDSMPGDVYIKGFIRNYAKFIGMDGDELLREFASERGIEVPPQPMKLSQAEEIVKSEATVRQPKVKVRESEPVRTTSKAFSSGDDYKSRVETGSMVKKILIGFCSIVFLFLASVYIIFSDEDTAPGAKPQPQVETKVEEVKETKPAANPDEIKVLVKLVDRCWMKVTVDGAVAFEGTAEPGLEMDWTGKKDVFIIAGNAGAVELVLDGKPAGKLGEVGQVAERHFTKETATANSKPAAQSKPETASQPAVNKSEASKPAVSEPAPAPVLESQPAAPEVVQPVEQSSASVQAAPAAEQAPAPTPNGNVAKKAQ